MSEKFDKKQYDMTYQKEYQAQFNVRMKKGEKEEIDSFLRENKLTQLELIRWGYKKLKERINVRNIENDNIKSIFLLNDIIRLFIQVQDDDFLKGKLSIRDIYMLLDSSYEELNFNEIETAIKKLESDKIIAESNEEYYLKYNR